MKNQNPSIKTPLMRLYVGEVKSPDDLAEVLAERSNEDRRRLGHRWLFCGSVEPDMFDVLRREPVDSLHQRVTGFVSSTGAAYGVLTHQVRGYQHRLVLPLFDGEIQQAVTTVSQEPFGFLLSKDGTEESLLLLRSSVTGDNLQGLPGLRKEVSDAQLPAMIAELPDVVMAITDAERIPSLVAQPTQSVSVSFVMPFNSMARIDLDIAKALR
jgi:hypothetical protein